MAGENCRSGCRSKDHESYADCLKAARPASSNSTQTRSTLYGLENQREVEVTAYRAARSQGIQPATTRLADINHAVASSQKAGQALTMTHSGDGVPAA